MNGYVEDSGTVVLTMTRDDYEQLLMVMTMGTAAASNGDRRHFLAVCALVNRVNAGSPNFTPYEIPAE